MNMFPTGFIVLCLCVLFFVFVLIAYFVFPRRFPNKQLHKSQKQNSLKEIAQALHVQLNHYCEDHARIDEATLYRPPHCGHLKTYMRSQSDLYVIEIYHLDSLESPLTRTIFTVSISSQIIAVCSADSPDPLLTSPLPCSSVFLKELRSRIMEYRFGYRPKTLAAKA